MKRFAVLMMALLGMVGCHTHLNEPDVMPPAAPSGLTTLPGDGFIEILWNRNAEADLAGYRVYVGSSYDGRYELIGTTSATRFVDSEARNGQLYFYAVSAYDFAGNESELSPEEAYSIARPEGYDVTLRDYRAIPTSAGFDFSGYTVVSFDDLYSDMYFENWNGQLYMNVREDTDIQDMGPTSSLLDVSVAPADGWSSTHDALLRMGHTYVVWTWDDHYAKFRVTSLSSGRVVFDWTYQLKSASPLLKRNISKERAPHTEELHHAR